MVMWLPSRTKFGFQEVELVKTFHCDRNALAPLLQILYSVPSDRFILMRVSRLELVHPLRKAQGGVTIVNIWVTRLLSNW